MGRRSRGAGEVCPRPAGSQHGADEQAVDLYNQLIAKPTTTVPAGLAQLQLADLYQAEGKTDAGEARSRRS